MSETVPKTIYAKTLKRGEYSLRRVLDFFFGLIILVFMGYFIIDYLNISEVQPYINDLRAFDWYDYVLWGFMAALVIIGIVLIILALRPSGRSNRLVWETETGNLEVSKQAIDSFIKSTINNERNLIHHDNSLVLRSTNNGEKSISGSIDVLWVADTHKDESSLNEINDRLRRKLQEFTHSDTRDLKLNVLDQHKETTRRVI